MKNLFRLTPFCLILSLSAAALANQPGQTTVQSKIEVATSQEKGSELQLEVRQMPLAQVLKEMEKNTATPIHFSVLPEGLITATCVGSTLKPVLECLLDHKADIIVRYAKAKSANSTVDNPVAEAWVLGAKLEALNSNAACKSSTSAGSISINSLNNGDTEKFSEIAKQSNLLLKVAQTGNPKDRAQAIGDLLSIGRENDPQVREMLEQSAHDPDSGVRAQAVSTLTHRDDYRENAHEIIREALQDDSVDVRLMAVDGITDDVGLLQQAVNDSEETISDFAKMKLQELMAKQKNQP